MLLSKQQKELLELLKKYGGMPIMLAKSLLAMQCKGVSIKMEPLLRQLVCAGMITVNNDIVLPGNGQISYNVIAALEVMPLLSPGGVEVHQPGAQPFTVTFFKQREQKLYRYDICVAEPGKEPVISAMLEGICRSCRVIVFIISEMEQRAFLTTDCECCFVLRENGKYRFYKPEIRNVN